MSTWNVAETRKHIEQRFGPSQLALTKPSLESLSDRQQYARYHYQEILRLFKAFSKVHLSKKPLIAVAYGEIKDREKFEIFTKKTGAHAVACVQSIHSLNDLLAHAIYLSLGLNLQPKPLRERGVSSTNVINILQRSALYQNLETTLSQLYNDLNFKHIAALSNKAKHQGIVRHQLNEDWTGTRINRHEIRFGAFQYSGQNFPETPIDGLLEKTYNLASKSIVDAGNEINRLYGHNAV